MDLHDFPDVAENYDFYLSSLLGVSDDGIVDFHMQLAQQYGAQGVVDIGCGTGATLLPLVQAGFFVTGLDLSAAMLAVLQRKLDRLDAVERARAVLLCANMTDFVLPKPVSLAVIPRSGFLHLLTSEDQERALRAIHAALLPGGILSLNTVDPNYEWIAANLKHKNPQPYLRAQYTNHLGRQERLWNQVIYDPAFQRIEAEWVFEELDEAGSVVDRRVRPLRMRFSFEPELRHLLRLCGFQVVDVYGSYRKEPRVVGSPLIWIVKKEA